MERKGVSEVEFRFTIKHKIGEDYSISELRIEGAEVAGGVEFRTRVYIDVDLAGEEVDWERIMKEIEFVRNVLKTKAENFRSNVQKLKGMLSVFGGVAEEVVYI